MLHYNKQHYNKLHYINTLRHDYYCNCNYTTLIIPHYNYNSATLQLQLQLHCTAIVGKVTTTTMVSHYALGHEVSWVVLLKQEQIGNCLRKERQKTTQSLSKKLDIFKIKF